ncbi:transcription factor bHLH041-like protein, partial [Trifolium pratense]
MRSLSAAGSPEYSSLIFNNIPTGRTSPSQFPPDHTHLGGSIIPPMRPISNTLPLQLQQFPQITPTQLFSTTQMNHQNDAIMRAIQNVISTPPSQQNLHGVHQEASAFGRNLNLMRLRDRSTQAMRPSSNQLHHMISERRRREKLNENFQALRALLPQGTK